MESHVGKYSHMQHLTELNSTVLNRAQAVQGYYSSPAAVTSRCASRLCVMCDRVCSKPCVKNVRDSVFSLGVWKLERVPVTSTSSRPWKGQVGAIHIIIDTHAKTLNARMI